MEKVGHALIVDDPERFKSQLESLISGLAYLPIGPACVLALYPLTGLSSILHPA